MRMETRRDNLHTELLRAQGELGNDDDYNDMDGVQCDNCSLDHVGQGTTCLGCQGTRFRMKLCTREYRVSEFGSRLLAYGVWSSPETLARASITELVRRLGRVREHHGHRCDGEEECPLWMALEHAGGAGFWAPRGVGG